MANVDRYTQLLLNPHQLGGAGVLLPVMTGRNVVGGGFTVYAGSPYQIGGGIGFGIGDILRRGFSFLFPTALRAITQFVSGAANASERGADWKTAMKEGLKPAAAAAIEDLGPKVVERLRRQSGSGRRKRKALVGKGKRVYKGSKIPKWERQHFKQFNF